MNARCSLGSREPYTTVIHQVALGSDRLASFDVTEYA